MHVADWHYVIGAHGQRLYAQPDGRPTACYGLGCGCHAVRRARVETLGRFAVPPWTATPLPFEG